MATDHGVVPARAASWALTSTSWPSPVRSRSRTAATAPSAPCTAAQSWARWPGALVGGSDGKPDANTAPEAASAGRGSRRHSARGPVRPRSVRATWTRCGWRAATSPWVRRAARWPAGPRSSTSTSAPARRASSRSRPSGPTRVEAHPALAGVAEPVGGRGELGLRRAAGDGQHHVGPEVGQDPAAQRAADRGHVDDAPRGERRGRPIGHRGTLPTGPGTAPGATGRSGPTVPP